MQTSILAGLVVKRRSLLDFLKNPYCFGIIGTIFENWVFKVLGLERRTLVVASKSYVMTGLQFFYWNNRKDSKVAESAIGMESGVLYNSSISNFGSTEGYAMVENTTTVSDSHRDAELRHIEIILRRARKKNPKVEYLLVYLTISGVQLTLPTCPTLNGKVKICTGNIDPDDFNSYFLIRSKPTSLT